MDIIGSPPRRNSITAAKPDNLIVGRPQQQVIRPSSSPLSASIPGLVPPPGDATAGGPPADQESE